MTDQVTSTAPTLKAPAEFQLLCDVCAKPLGFTHVKTSVTVRSDDVIGDMDGVVAYMTYRSECGREIEIQATGGWLIIVQETAPHGG